jgi:hypothetical protein
MGVASLFGFVEASHTQESPVTAIDILLNRTPRWFSMREPTMPAF